MLANGFVGHHIMCSMFYRIKKPKSTIPDAICPNFIQGDGQGGEEKYIGDTVDKFECIKKVQQQFPKAEGVTYSKNGRGNKCYVEHKWTHASGSPLSQRNWQTCRIGKLFQSLQ